jgi:undecaprenyl-diphosphatase
LSLQVSIDRTLLQALYAGRLSPSWVALIVAVSFLGSGWMMLGLVPALFSRALRGPAAALLVMLGLLSAVVASAKEIVGRVRPCHALAWAHVLPLSLPTDCSFPSGHAAGSFAIASFVLVLHRTAGIALVPIAVMIALSRVALGVHYPSDVLAGAALGSAIGYGSARLFLTLRERSALRQSP